MSIKAKERWLIPFIILAVFPLIAWTGALFLRNRQYDIISIFLALLSCIPFYITYEKKRNQTAELVLIAVMIALAVLGRIIFAPLPGMSPVTAIAALTAFSFGPAAGFLVGSLSAVVSNVLFGQGPWTPFQMMAWGFTGYGAGILFKWGVLHKPWQLGLFGFCSGLVFSLVMDVWTVLALGEGFQWSRYLAILITAAPFTVIYAASNAVFLVVLKQPVGRRLERIRKKYGL